MTDGQVTRRDTTCIAQQIGGKSNNGKGRDNTKEATATAALATEQTTLFVYNQAGQLIGEYDASGNPIWEYVYLEGVPLALIANGSIHYYHTDHLGTPQKLTDASGSIAWDAIYDPFGEANLQASQVDQPLRFPGQYFDAETGLHQNWHRNYVSHLGRYKKFDPIGLLGGMNGYVYSYQDPIRLYDPTGLETPTHLWRENIRPPRYMMGGNLGAGGAFQLMVIGMSIGTCQHFPNTSARFFM